ncbi:27629_t:CDS:1, partial [Gigaspora margarita]
TDTNNNGFPATIKQLNQQIQQYNLPTKWKFSIDKQEEFSEAADFLCRTFLIETSLNLVSLSHPSYSLAGTSLLTII